MVGRVGFFENYRLKNYCAHLQLIIEYYLLVFNIQLSFKKCNSYFVFDVDQHSGADSDDDVSAGSIWRSVFSCVRELGARLGWSLAQYFTPDANREVGNLFLTINYNEAVSDLFYNKDLHSINENS